jgi:trk system potassium uptake protein
VPAQRTSVRAAARPVALVLLGIAGGMAATALVGAAYEILGLKRGTIDDGAALAMFFAAAITASAGLLVRAWGKGHEAVLGRREAVIAVSAIWFSASLFGALPYMLDARLPLHDAVFEAASGFTTTGATIVADIEATLSRPLLLWRSLTQWLGGMGIVVLFVAIFPNLGVTGKKMFRREVPGVTADGLRPRITETSVVLWQLYLGFTAAHALSLWLLGLGVFEAVCHAMTTLSTGGFSTRNDSLGAFDSAAVEMVTAAFMLLAGVNFGLYYAALRVRRARVMFRSVELQVYAIGTVVLMLSLTGLLISVHGTVPMALRKSIFMVATTVTSTGFGTDSYMAYPSLALLLVVGMMFVGGCSGSTAGGIKVNRIILLVDVARAMVRRSVRPSVVQAIRLEGKVVDTLVLLEVTAFFFVYMAVLAVGCAAVTTLDGVAVPTAFGAMLTSLSNMGPAPFYEGADNFAGYSPAAKGVFSVAMVMGRLELFTVLALVLPDLWRR